MKDYKKIGTEAVKGASKGAVFASAASVISGIAMASVPVKVLGFITVGTSTVVAAPVIASVAVGGAVVGGASAAYFAYRRQSRIEKQFHDAVNS